MAEGNLQKVEKTIIGLLVIGLIGILFLIIFGNLSGNLGFQDKTQTITTINETTGFINETGYTLAVVNSSTSNYVLTALWNETDNGVGSPFNLSIPLGNATVSSSGVVTNASVFNWNVVSISYTYRYTFDSEAEQNSEQVIGNLTGGVVEFFTFSNVWFILLAISLLIAIVIGVIALVRRTGQVGSNVRNGSNFT